uniref:BTB/POZ and MATH domain-containing protein 3-like isoform X2 n=1 Tax=Tanacetum cinerariifolium TaxID=118510 RepID=A0A6L2K8K4_TANCI|nr:BTB/POZ and MATH domain-containing protein 3-like isoform X2 [Tanacetum cinerariifolium]
MISSSPSTTTNSKSINESINGSHDFTIRGYSLAKGMGAGKYISSDTFSVGGYDWAIYFYPDGKNQEDNATYVSVFIALASDGTDVRALFELTLLDQSGKGKHKVHSHFDRALESGPYTLKYRGSMDWFYDGGGEFIFIVCFVLFLFDCEVSNRKFARILCLDQLRQQSVYSMNYRVMFYSEHQAHIDLDSDTCSKDTLPDSEELSSSMSMCTSTNMIQHLLAAADRFGLDRLKQLCEAQLCEEVNADTVAATLSLADQHRCSQLKAICLKFAAANLGAVMQTEGYKYVEQTCPLLLSELLETVASVAVDERPGEGGGLSRKRSGSSVMGLDLAAAQMPAAAESGEPYARRLRRRL